MSSAHPPRPLSRFGSDVQLTDPPNGRKVRWNFLAYGTAATTVTHVQYRFEYEHFVNGQWKAADPITGNNIPTYSSGGTKLWELYVGVVEDGKNGVLTVFNAKADDGGSTDGHEIDGKPGADLTTVTPRAAAAALGAARISGASGGDSYLQFGTYDPDEGCRLVGIVKSRVAPDDPIMVVPAVAADGIWVMLFEKPDRTPPPYTMLPVLLNETDEVVDFGVVRFLF